MKLKDLQGKCR